MQRIITEEELGFGLFGAINTPGEKLLLDLGGENATVYLLRKEDGIKKWIMLLEREHPMNNASTAKSESVAGWSTSYMRLVTCKSIWLRISPGIDERILPVENRQIEFSKERRPFLAVTKDYVWLYDYDEILPQSSEEDLTWLWRTLKEGSAGDWWLRSADYSAGFRCVSSGGDTYYANASGLYGVALGFCTRA